MVDVVWFGLKVLVAIAAALVIYLIGARSMWQRTVYMDRRTGPVDFREDRDRRIGPIFQFTVSGKF